MIPFSYLTVDGIYERATKSGKYKIALSYIEEDQDGSDRKDERIGDLERNSNLDTQRQMLTTEIDTPMPTAR